MSDLRPGLRKRRTALLHGHPNHARRCYPHFIGFSETIGWVWCPFPARWISCIDGIPAPNCGKGIEPDVVPPKFVPVPRTARFQPAPRRWW